MKRKRFTEEQIIGVLREHELGTKTADLCRKHGISEATFYNWKSKFGGLDVSDVNADSKVPKSAEVKFPSCSGVISR
jgi:transposase-like protein